MGGTPEKGTVAAITLRCECGEEFQTDAAFDKSGKALLSCRVLILPRLDQESLFKQFHLDEPWDSPHNLPLAAQVPAVFQCPSEASPEGTTTYQVIVHPRSMFTGRPEGVAFKRVADGSANTILVAEAAEAVMWTKPEELSLDSEEPRLGMGSKHPGGFNVSMADESILFFRDWIDDRQLEALATRSGGEVVSPP